MANLIKSKLANIENFQYKEPRMMGSKIMRKSGQPSVSRVEINGGYGWLSQVHARTRALGERIFLFLLRNRGHLKWTVCNIGNSIFYSEQGVFLTISHPKKGLYRLFIDIYSEYERMYFSPKGRLIPGDLSIHALRVYPDDERKRNKSRPARDSASFRLGNDDMLFETFAAWLAQSYKTPFISDKNPDSMMDKIQLILTVQSAYLSGWTLGGVEWIGEKVGCCRIEQAHYRAALAHPDRGEYGFHLQIEDKRKEGKPRVINECTIHLFQHYTCEDGIDRSNFARLDSRDQNLALKWFFGFLKSAGGFHAR